MLPASKIPVDSGVPQLGLIANEGAMATLFGAHLLPGWTLARCHIKEVRYYPGATCLLSYHLRLEAEGREESTLVLHARAFGAEPVPDAFRTRPPLSTPAGRLPSFLPQLGLALWMFPDDPGILGLAEVWRRGGAVFDRPGILEHSPWPGRRPAIDSTVVSYVPAKRCILRYDRLDLERPDPVFGKVYANEDARQLYAQMRDLWEYAGRAAPELVLARPLGYDPGSNALWQSSPGGEPMLEALGAVDLPATMRRVAAALAALHRADVRPSRVWSGEEEHTKLERARAALLRFYPSLGREIESVLGAILATGPGSPPRQVPVHGDFHCNQVLVQEDRVAVIDFDLFGLGDPLHDVARFLSRFRAFTTDRMPVEDARRAIESFVSTYEILVPWRLDRRRLGWLAAALLVNRQALKPVKKLSAGGLESVAEMLETAAAFARGGELA
jgi:aminoglycoside phosphotransferase